MDFCAVSIQGLLRTLATSITRFVYMSMGLAMQPPVQGMTFGVVQRRSAKASRCRTDRESPRRVSAGDTSLTVKKKEEGVKEMEILRSRPFSRRVVVSRRDRRGSADAPFSEDSETT